jgi:hypothetical protein
MPHAAKYLVMDVANATPVSQSLDNTEVRNGYRMSCASLAHRRPPLVRTQYIVPFNVPASELLAALVRLHRVHQLALDRALYTFALGMHFATQAVFSRS